MNSNKSEFTQMIELLKAKWGSCTSSKLEKKKTQKSKSEKKSLTVQEKEPLSISTPIVEAEPKKMDNEKQVRYSYEGGGEPSCSSLSYRKEAVTA